jgi:3-oxoacyl-[acyl-carrier protein] reductase
MIATSEVDSMERLSGKAAVITGGGRGIGLAAAKMFLGEGAVVEIWDNKIDAAGRELRARHEGRLCTTNLDVRNRDAVKEAAEAFHARCGKIDILVNNAGITFGYIGALQLDREKWRAVIDTNLEGTVHCVQAVVPHMKRRGAGSIVNVTSVLASYGFPGQTAYVASKSALVGLTRVWAREFGPFGVRVNAVSPGYITTPMNEPNPPELVERVLSRTALGRLGKPEDAAKVYLFLSSDEASFLTGAVIPVDGGFIP